MIIIDSKLCKGCDICINVCPKKVYSKSDRVNAKNVYLPFVVVVCWFHSGGGIGENASTLFSKQAH